jgi:hypothetical protein
MGIEFISGGPEDQGPGGVVARFMLATSTGDTDGAMTLLSESCREGTELHEQALTEAVVTIGEAVVEESVHIVPTKTVEGESIDETEFVLVEEGGEFRIDLDKTMERAMGFDPNEMMQQMGEAMAEGMGQVMDGVADAMGEALGGAFGAVGDPADHPGRRWILNEEEVPADEIMTVAQVIGENLDPPFTPDEQEVDREETREEDVRTRKVRFGSEDAGWAVTRTSDWRGSNVVTTLIVDFYGLPDCRALTIERVDTERPGEPSEARVSVTYRAPTAMLDAFHEMANANVRVIEVEDC